MRDDPELDELFTDPADREVVDLLHASRPAAPPLEPNFRSYLRMKLMAEARRALPEPGRLPRLRLVRTPPPWLRWAPVSAVALAAGLLLFVAGQRYLQGRQPQIAQVQVSSGINNQTNVARAEPIRLRFSGPVDKTAVQETVEIQPATRYTTRWEDQTLVIVPDHPLAANTGYTVRVKPAVAAPAPQAGATAAPPPAPVVVRFVTAPTPPPPALAQAFTSANLRILSETPIPGSARVSGAAWAPDGQSLVVARPTSAVVGASPSPAGTPPVTITDAWLMSPKGTFVRQLAPRANFPVAAPSGGHLAFWRFEGPADQATLRVGTLDPHDGEADQVATLHGLPDRAPIWVGADRVAYVEGSALHVIDLQGNELPSPPFKIRAAVAAAADGRVLAAVTPDGLVLYELASQRTMPLRLGSAVSLAWSSGGDLAIVGGEPGASELWVFTRDGKGLRRLRGPADGEVWSDLNWSPDGKAILFARRPAEGSGTSSLLIADLDGTGTMPFGASKQEYTAPRWSPQGPMLLFNRRNETGRSSLFLASIRAGELSPADSAQLDALKMLDQFMQARRNRDRSAAEAKLGPDALAAYQSGTPPLLSRQDPSFARSYVVSVQLVNPDKFLVDVRTVQADASSKQETSFFEEHLTLVRHGPAFLVDAVEPGASIRLGRGPTVVSVDVRPDTSRQQVLVHFDSDLDVTTVSRNTVFIRDEKGTAVAPAAFAFDQSAHLATLTLPLKPGAYQLVVTTAVTDFTGQALTQEYTAPVVIAE